MKQIRGVKGGKSLVGGLKLWRRVTSQKAGEPQVHMLFWELNFPEKYKILRSIPASSASQPSATIVVVLMRWRWQKHRRYLGCVFVKLYPVSAAAWRPRPRPAGSLTLTDPALWWKFTSLWFPGPCRPPGGALLAACFTQVRPLQTTTSPVMVFMFRPAETGITGWCSVWWRSSSGFDHQLLFPCLWDKAWRYEQGKNSLIKYW